MKLVLLPALMIVTALTVTSSGAQTLLHRYSFNGNARDSVAKAHGTVVGSVTLSATPYVNGLAVFGGGTTNAKPSYIALPLAAVSTLQNTTVELFITNFNMPNKYYGMSGGQFQTLFALASAAPNTANYVVLSPDRQGSGIGTGARTNGTSPDQVIAAPVPLADGIQNHVVDLVYSGFKGVGSRGVETIYVDGVPVAQGNTIYSFAAIATGKGGIATVGIGGGSPYNDPTFSGSISEVRIFDSALTPAQIAANVDAGPAYLGFPTATLAQLQVSAASANAGATLAGKVTLTGVAPAGGQPVLLTSSKTVVSVPPHVVVPQGQNSVRFPISLAGVDADTTATISAKYATSARTASVTVKAATLSTLTLAPVSVYGGQSATLRVGLTGLAGPGGVPINLMSSSVPTVSLPKTLTVARGTAVTTLPVMPAAVGAQVQATLSAAQGAITRSAALTILPPVLTGFTAPVTVKSGKTLTFTVQLNAVAPKGGMQVAMTSDNAAIAATTATVPAGATIASVTVMVGKVAATTTVTLTATLGSVHRTVVVKITP